MPTESVDIQYVTPDNTTFEVTEGRMLNVTVNGEEHHNVYLHCSFPHTDRSIFISIRTGENEEIGMIKSLDDFPEDAVRLLDKQINIRYFAPEVLNVVKITEEFGYSYWETETTSGFCRFTVRSGGGNLKFVTETRLLILDVDGNRFIIPDIDQLSSKEYRMVEMCL